MHGVSGNPVPALVELHIADPPERWRALGFDVDEDGSFVLGGVRIGLGGSGGGGITAWAIRGIDISADGIDGLETVVPIHPPSEPASHPNGATGLDHVVILTPDFDRTAAALEKAGMPLTRVREVGRGPDDPGSFRQGFRRLGPAILELVEVLNEPPRGPARFWGLVVVVKDIDALADRLGERVGKVRTAVQPGRRITTLRSSAELGPAVAFMDPEPER
jgi:hypothetical protein